LDGAGNGDLAYALRLLASGQPLEDIGDFTPVTAEELHKVSHDESG